MKKLFKALLVFACAGTLCAGALAMSACGGSKDTGAYGLVHGAGYVGYATVTVDKEDKVTDATLTEYCFPTQVKDADGGYYSEVSYGKVTMKYDEEGKTYKVGEQTLKEYFKDEDNCKTYVKAVNDGKVYVTVDGVKKNDVMTKAALCKDDNGYGGTKFDWKKNRDATVNYVKTYGVAELLKLEPEEWVTDKNGNPAPSGVWSDSNNVSTGATWTDLNTVKEGTLSYAQLIVKAFNKVAKTPVNA